MNISQLRSLILEVVVEEKSNLPIKRSEKYSIKRLLEQDEQPLEQLAQQVDAKPVTLVVLYGPPAAGKGAAKGAVGDFAGVDADTNFEDWLDSMSKDDASAFFSEEDEAMVSAMTQVLPPLVFKELASRIQAGENFDSVVAEYWHENESGNRQELGDVLNKASFESIMTDNDGNIDAGAEEFAAFPNTAAFFTQARGFSKKINGAPEDLNGMLGVTGPGNSTLGARAMAAGKYMGQVKDEIKAMGAKEVGDMTYASVYLMDQAGESSADTGRIAELGKLKEDPDFPSVTIIGIYVHQPKERTTIANLHRAATGGRRVAQSEVERIFSVGPEIVDGKITEKGDAITAMEQAGFDQIHVYTPPNPFTPKDAEEFKGKICQPLGSGKGSLDIEGCPGDGTDARSLAGMEKQAVKKAELEDKSEDGGIPSDLSAEELEKVAKALQHQGWNADGGDVKEYLTTMAPPGVRDGGKHGKVPWSVELFGDDWKGDKASVKGRSPTDKITVKEGLLRSQNNRDNVVLERWQKLAGIKK